MSLHLGNLDKLVGDKEYIDQVHKDLRNLESSAYEVEFFRENYKKNPTDLMALQYALSWAKLVSARERLVRTIEEGPTSPE